MEQETICTNCSSINLKEGKVGYAAHAYVCEDTPSTIFNGGTRSKLLTTFCLDCGVVQSFKVENPKAFKK
ncbi:TPA: hypothetical protein ACGW7V_006326 [Bacillus cereus]